MNMLGSILSAGAAKPAGLIAAGGEGAEGAAAGLGEMFAAVIAAASAPAAAGASAEAGAEGGATPLTVPAATPADGDADPALVSELTLAVLGNGGVARGEAQSLPTPEPLPEKRVLARAPEGEAQVPSGMPGTVKIADKGAGKAVGKAPNPVLTPTGFDQPVLTRTVGGKAAQPVIAGVVDPTAVLQPGESADGTAPGTAKPTRRAVKKAEADAPASPATPATQPDPVLAAVLAGDPSAAASPVPLPAAAPAPGVVQRKSIGAYRSGAAAVPLPQTMKPVAQPLQPAASKPEAANATAADALPVAAPIAAVVTRASTAPSSPETQSAAPSPEVPVQVPFVARASAEAAAPATTVQARPDAVDRSAAPVAAGPHASAVSAEAGPQAAAKLATAGTPAKGQPAPLATDGMAVPVTPSPVRATRMVDAAPVAGPRAEQKADAGQAIAAPTATAPRPSRDAVADGAKRPAAETAAPSAATPVAVAATATPQLDPTPLQAPTVDGAPRIEASATAGPQLGAVLSDQVIDMGIDGQWIDRLAREITQVADGTGHSRFQLMPPNLGRIQVDLWQGDAGGRVHLLTETDEAAARLRDGQSMLQSDARLAALSLGQVVIERAAGGNLDAQRDQNGQQHNPQQPHARQDMGQAGQQNGQQQGQAQPQGSGQNATGSGPSQGQSGNSGGQHGKPGDPRAVLENRGQDAGTATGGEGRVRYA